MIRKNSFDMLKLPFSGDKDAGKLFYFKKMQNTIFNLHYVMTSLTCL